MKPIRVSTTVEQPREEVFAFLDVLANHEAFTDHMLVDWSFSGPAAGVGARSRLRANLPGPKDWAELEVLDAEPPATIVEETVGAGGRRRTRGTYRLTDLPAGGTRVEFELAFLAVPGRERLVLPPLRAWLRRGNEKAMRRLAQSLAQRPSPQIASAPSPAA
jgi:uncharacterized protein YndB with AHSA1/START domain